MDIPDKEIGDYLNSIGGFVVYQDWPEKLVVDEFPLVIYLITQNVPEYDLDKEIGRQNIEVTMDIWTETPTQRDAILNAIESKMRTYGYLLNSNLDITDPGGYCHKNIKFIY